MPSQYLVRHTLFARLFHWLTAVAVLILLVTGLLPRFGVNFDWVVIHWVTGMILTLLVFTHIVHSLAPARLRRIWFTRRDFSGARPGKYSLPQKSMHQFVALLTLLAVITGILMTVRIDTPLWERNPYWLTSGTWAWIYVLHGLSALLFVTTLMLHIYFSLRPEKRMYLSAMFGGRVSTSEYHAIHDANAD